MSEMTDAPETTEEEVPDKSKGSRRESSSGIGGGLAIFLALIAIGIASYPAYETYRQAATPEAETPDTTREEIAALEAQIKQLQATIAATDRQLEEVASSVGGSDKAANQIREDIGRELDEIRSRLGTSAQDWIYAEVEYLVRMANQRVLMEKDATSALYLLQSADDIIREAEGLVAHELRESLAQDIAALKAIDAPDTQGVYLELSALIQQVDSLKRILPVYSPVVGTPQSDLVEAGMWQRFLQVARQAGSRFASLIDFRRGSVEVQPILPPKEAYYLRQNLVMKLQMAQLALLEGDEAVYRSAIDEASEWISDSFDPEDAASVAMQESLNRLSDISVSVNMPDISGSLIAARNRVGALKGAGVK